MGKDYSKVSKYELKKLLTKKQIIFCHEYINEWNGTQSYFKAYPHIKNENVAAAAASRLLRNVKIKAYIDKIKDNIEEEAGISKLWAIKRHKQIVNASFQKLHSGWFEKEEWNTLVEQHPEILDCIEEISTKVIQKNLGTKEDPDIYDVEYVKIKLPSKQKSLDSIAKMLGWDAPIKMDHTTKGDPITSISINVIKPDKSQTKEEETE